MGAVIHAAYPNEAWPGAAAVVTSRVHVRKGDGKALAICKALLSRIYQPSCLDVKIGVSSDLRLM